MLRENKKSWTYQFNGLKNIVGAYAPLAVKLLSSNCRVAPFYKAGVVWCKPGWGNGYMAGSKNQCNYEFYNVGIVCDPSIEFITNRH
jgi:hypothetical protein